VRLNVVKAVNVRASFASFSLYRVSESERESVRGQGWTGTHAHAGIYTHTRVRSNRYICLGLGLKFNQQQQQRTTDDGPYDGRRVVYHFLPPVYGWYHNGIGMYMDVRGVITVWGVKIREG